jgi:CHC2 zinc finger
VGEFIKEQLPDPVNYYESEGLMLQRGKKWRTTRCDFHGGSDSMRINADTGAFVCMAGCGARGGDVLAYHMAAHGLPFVEAAKALGAYRDDGKPHRGPARPTPIPARDLLQSVDRELKICALVLSDALAGKFNDDDYDRYRAAAAHVIFIAGVANA